MISNQTTPLEITQKELTLAEGFANTCRTSILVIMFTDIEGSTKAGSQLGNIAAQMQRQLHDRITEETVVGEGKGKVIKSTGDGVLAVFSDPTLAVQRALKIQDRFLTYNKDKDIDEQIWVRIGLDMGQVLLEEYISNLDIFGNHVNRAARIMSLADGGHIYVSGRVYDDAVAWLKHMEIDGEIGWEFYGRCRLKGVDPSPEVYEVFTKGGIEPKAPDKTVIISITSVPDAGHRADAGLAGEINEPAIFQPLREYGNKQIMPNDILLDNWTVANAFDLLEEYKSLDVWDMNLSCLAVLVESIVIHGKIYVDSTYSEAWRYKTYIPARDIYEPYSSTDKLSAVVKELYLDKDDSESVSRLANKRLTLIQESPVYKNFLQEIKESEEWNILIQDTYFAEQPDRIELLGTLQYLEMSRLLRMPYVSHFLRTPIVLLNATVSQDGDEELSSARHLIQYVEKMRVSSVQPINEFYQKHVFDLHLPSILSIVLRNSKNPDDVLGQALKLREAEEVIDFRNYCMLMDSKIREGDIAFLNEAISTLKCLSDKMATGLNGIRREKVWGIGHHLGIMDSSAEKDQASQTFCYLPRLIDESNSVKTIRGELSRVFGMSPKLKGFWGRDITIGSA